MNRHATNLGFTLLEVLVALAIVAITLAAAIKVSGEFSVNAAYLKEKTLAQWIAENRAEEIRLSGSMPAIGKQEGETEMAERVWRWQVKTSNTEDTRLRRLDIAVIAENGDFDQPIATLVAFMSSPL